MTCHPSAARLCYSQTGSIHLDLTILNLVTYHGVQHPTWVHNDLALPELASSGLGPNEDNEMNSTVKSSLQTEVMRSRL